MLTVTPTEHEKREWSRMASAAYREQRNPIGHRYSMAATLCHDEPMPLDRFEILQAGYRAWLVFNEWPPV
jgi:hypothetical protein